MIQPVINAYWSIASGFVPLGSPKNLRLYSLGMISLTVSDLQKKFGRARVFENINFDVSGGVLGISGPNGSGKSTLMKCLCGLYTPTSGAVAWKIHGKEIALKEIRFKSGYAAPYINLYDELSIAENISFVCKASGGTFSEKKLVAVLNELGLQKKISTPFKSLSSGQQQRVKLAVAFFNEPEIIFLDEPGTNLDEDGKAGVFSLVEKLQKAGSMVIIASNASDEIQRCDNVISVVG